MVILVCIHGNICIHIQLGGVLLCSGTAGYDVSFNLFSFIYYRISSWYCYLALTSAAIHFGTLASAIFLVNDCASAFDWAFAAFH